MCKTTRYIGELRSGDSGLHRTLGRRVGSCRGALLLGLPKLKITVRYPADINLALYPEQYSDTPRLYLYARLPLQFFIGVVCVVVN
jgi:uncharacterized membrane protein